MMDNWSSRLQRIKLGQLQYAHLGEELVGPGERLTNSKVLRAIRALALEPPLVFD